MKKPVLALLLCLAAGAVGAEDLPKGAIFTTSDGIEYVVIDADKQEVAINSAKGVTSLAIPDYARQGITPYKVVQITQGIFMGNTTLTHVSGGPYLKAVGDNTFKDCTALVKVDIQSADVKWGADVFNGCTKLVEASIDGDISDADRMFYECVSLEKVAFGNNVSAVPQYCFDDCRQLTEVSGMGGVTAIGPYAFFVTDKLTGMEWPAGLVTLGEYAFQYSAITCDVTLMQVENLGAYALASSSISSVVFNDGIKEIPEGFCEGCRSLASVTLPGAVTEICRNAFYNTGITEIEIPATVTKIGLGAFVAAIKSVKAYPVTPPEITDNSSTAVFSEGTYRDGTLYVKEGSLQDYSTAFVWEKFKSISSLPDNTSVGEVEAARSDAPTYYGLDGKPVADPRGIVIEVRGGKAGKVVR